MDIINLICQYVSHLDDSLWYVQFNAVTGAMKCSVNRYYQNDYMPFMRSMTYKYEWNRPNQIHARVSGPDFAFSMRATLFRVKETDDYEPHVYYNEYIFQLEGCAEVASAYNHLGDLIPMRDPIHMHINTGTKSGRGGKYNHSRGSAKVCGLEYSIYLITNNFAESISLANYNMEEGCVIYIK